MVDGMSLIIRSLAVEDSFTKADGRLSVVSRIQPAMKLKINDLPTTRARTEALDYFVAKTLLGDWKSYRQGTVPGTPHLG
jgi:hypothetical protein